MKKIQIKLENGTVVGEGCASEGKDLTEAVETLTPMLKMFPKARLVIEDTTKEEFNEGFKKHFERTYDIPCYLSVKASSEDEAYDKALKMALNIPNLVVDTSNFEDDDYEDDPCECDWNECFKDDNEEEPSKSKIYLFENVEENFCVFGDGKPQKYVFVVAKNKAAAIDMLLEEFDQWEEGPTEISRDRAMELGIYFFEDDPEDGVYDYH